MYDFERKLKGLFLSKPSEKLRDQIFGEQDHLAGPLELLHKPVPLCRALAFALIMGIVGFMAAHISARLPGTSSIVPGSTLEVYIIDGSSARHAFDLTRNSTSFMSGELTRGIETDQKI